MTWQNKSVAFDAFNIVFMPASFSQIEKRNKVYLTYSNVTYAKTLETLNLGYGMRFELVVFKFLIL